MNMSIQSIKTGIKTIKNRVNNSDFTINIKNIHEEIKEAKEIGKVHKDGVTDNSVLDKLGPATKGLEDYAKANNVNITFHTPQKPIEVGSNLFEKPLTITAYKNGITNGYMTERTIDGDVTAISRAKVEIPTGKNKKITADIEDSFLGRVYRNISEMTNEINAKRRYDKEHSFWGASIKEVRSEIRESNHQIKEGIKDFAQMFNPFKKKI